MVFTQPVDRLHNILTTYQTHFSGNSHDLLKSISISDWWRFFVDYDDQDFASEFKSVRDHLFTNFTEANLKMISVATFLKESNFTYTERFSNWGYDESKDGNLSLFDYLNSQRAWIPYENREPGYLASMYLAFTNLIYAPGKSLETGLIKSIHNLIMSNIKHISGAYHSRENLIGDFRDYSTNSFPLYPSNTTLQGVYQLLKNILDGNLPIKLVIRNKMLNQQHDLQIKDKDLFYQAEALYKIITMTDSAEIINVECNVNPNDSLNIDVASDLTIRYDAQIKELNTLLALTLSPKQKLRIIVDFIQRCEQTHPFFDGNTRVNYLLLNMLLKEHGFPPCILIDPNHFGGYALDQMITEVVDGMERSLRLGMEHKITEYTNEDLKSLMPNDKLHMFNSVIQQIENVVENIDKAVYNNSNQIKPV